MNYLWILSDSLQNTNMQSSKHLWSLPAFDISVLSLYDCIWKCLQNDWGSHMTFHCSIRISTPSHRMTWAIAFPQALTGNIPIIWTPKKTMVRSNICLDIGEGLVNSVISPFTFLSIDRKRIYNPALEKWHSEENPTKTTNTSGPRITNKQ